MHSQTLSHLFINNILHIIFYFKFYNKFFCQQFYVGREAGNGGGRGGGAYGQLGADDKDKDIKKKSTNLSIKELMLVLGPFFWPNEGFWHYI